MRKPFPVSNLMEAFLGGVSPDLGEGVLLVFGIHRRNDLFLHFDAPAPGDTQPLDHLLEWDCPDALLADVQSEADRPGGIRHVVFPTNQNWERDWMFARDFSAQAAANVWAKAEEHEKAGVARLQERLMQTTRAFADGKRGR